ncbi:hypothetical protein AOQ84DRAFT_168442 [Glonium stellatum]|uniref:Tachykinin family protein n=1 Tax=Glonium stellatum TaxID=574774 RepID=A0A8E2EQB0_9PEZI|nr:hypothetical protein AOQ84DRAFT_168442 [Glonium stellatum]
MQFTFVTHNGPRPEKAVLVKSHVMRESQKARKQAKERKNGYMPPKPIYGPNISQSYLNGETSPREPVVAPIVLSPWGQPSSEFVTLEQKVAGPWVGERDEPTINDADAKSFEITDMLFDSMAAYSYFKPDKEDMTIAHNNGIFLTQYNNPLNTTRANWPPPIKGPGSQRGAPNDLPGLSPYLLSQILEMMVHYIDTSWLDSPESPAVRAKTYWTRQAILNQNILLSCSLFYSAHRDVFRNTPSNEYFHLKDLTLRAINESFANPETATSDESIAAVLGVCSSENVKGSPAVAMHLSGLRQMVEMRGGLNNLRGGSEALVELLLLQDILHAVCSNVAPLMLEIRQPTLRKLEMHKQPLCTNSPLQLREDIETINARDGLRREVHVALMDAFEGTEMLYTETIFVKSETAVETLSFQNRRRKIGERLAAIKPLNFDKDYINIKDLVEEAARLAANIHYRAVALRIRHEDPINTPCMRTLSAVLQKIDMRIWKAAKYVYLWILLTGAAASNGHPDERPLFMIQLIRFGLTVGLLDWESFELHIGNFLWLQRELRKSRPMQSLL